MRVAALYDIHGNLPALDAVLGELDAVEPDVILVGGDIAAGPMPRQTLERLRARGAQVRLIRGNADRRWEGSGDDADIWVVRGRWLLQQLDDEEQRFLDGLPEHAVLDVEGLGPVLFCHGSPRSDEEIVTEATSDARLREILAGTEQRVVVCGHTHMQCDRLVDGSRVVNAGSVGMPYEGEPGAYWALLGPGVELRRTVYDFERAAEAIRATGYPDAREYADLLFERPPRRKDVIEFFEQAAEERASG